MSVFEMSAGTGVRVKAISFAGGGNPEQPVTHRGLIVLEWCAERQDSEYEEGKAGKLKFWLAGPDGKPVRDENKRRTMTTEAASPYPGIPNVPIMMQPILVWAPGESGQGMIDPSVPGDFGVRQLILGTGKDLTFAILKRAKDIQRLKLDPTDNRLKGQLWPGDVIDAGWHGKDGKTKQYDGPQTQVYLGNDQTQQFAAQAYARHQEWIKQRQAELAAAEGIVTGAQVAAPSFSHTSGVMDSAQPTNGHAPTAPAAPTAPPVAPTLPTAPVPPAGAVVPGAPAVPVPPAAPAPVAAAPAAPAAPDPAAAFAAWQAQQAAAAAAAAPPVDPDLVDLPAGVPPEEWKAYKASLAANQAAAAAQPTQGALPVPNFRPPAVAGQPNFTG